MRVRVRGLMVILDVGSGFAGVDFGFGEEMGDT
jgi:hypothetical protein